MSNAVMPLTDYVAACDAVREKTGSAETIKSGEMPDKINDVFKAGQFDIISRAESLKGSAKGTSVTINDISPVEHNVSCTVESKNIFNGELEIWRNADRIMPKECIKVKPNTWYKITVYDYTIKAPTFAFYGNNTGVIGDYGINTDTVIASITTAFNSGSYEYIWFRQWSTMTEDGITLDCRVQIEEVEGQQSPATDFTPYIEDLSAVKINQHGKNLFNSDLTLNTQTVNGITVDNEGDGIFHFHGTATQTFTYSFMPTNIGVRIDPSKTYIVCVKLLEGKVENMNSLHPYIGIGATPTESQNYNNATLKSDSVAGEIYSTPYPTPVINRKSDAKYISNFWFYMYGMQEGATIDFKIQVWIIQGVKGEEWEPYIDPTEHTANADGIVNGVKSLYPNMTLIPDTDGVVISAEYIKDIDKAFEAVTTAVALTGGE